MKVERFKEILNNLRDDDDIAIVWWDYEEMGDHAEEKGISLSRSQWAQVVKKFERRLDIDAPLMEFLDQCLEAFRPETDDWCDECDESNEDCCC
jgi:hypothetical protein